MKPDIDAAMTTLADRVQRIGDRLLESAEFSSMKTQIVPATLAQLIKEDFAEAKREYQELDAATNCPQTLSVLRGIDDASLNAGIAQTLSGMRTALQEVEGKSRGK